MNIDKWLQTSLKCELLLQIDVKRLCRLVKQLLFEQSNVQPVKCPVNACGDVHGQFYDVKNMFEIGGKLPDTTYIMIGDFVDRGFHSIETITLLFCYKLKYPDKIVLLRGNHQSRSISKNYGFYNQCISKYGTANVWQYFNDSFDYLPLGAIVEGQIFCVHGGLSPYMNTIDQIRSIERNQQIPSSGVMTDLLWSDPSDEIETWGINTRGAGWLYGKKSVDNFLHINDVQLIVRAHQLAQEGYQMKFENQLCIIWSAPNYMFRMGNKAAILHISDKLERSFTQYTVSKDTKSSEDLKFVFPYFL